jgi:hypothetical protein
VLGDFFHLPHERQREYRPLLADWFVRRHAERLAKLGGERPRAGDPRHA